MQITVLGMCQLVKFTFKLPDDTSCLRKGFFKFRMYNRENRSTENKTIMRGNSVTEREAI
jgi:hypothetical protein